MTSYARWLRWPHWLPRGGSLPESAWLPRHRAVVVLLWVHVVAIPVYAVHQGNTLGHAWVETSPVLIAALLAGHVPMRRSLQSAIAAGGLMIASGVVVHLAEGMIEAHFHFFVMIPVVALYEAWLPFALGVGYVLIHHGVMGTLDPRVVYNHPAAWEHPWVFAGVHAGFFAAASIACIVNWWLHEQARETAQGQHRLMKTMVESLQEGLVVVDRQGEVLLVNPAGVALAGADPVAHGAGHDRPALYHPDGTPAAEHELPHALALAGQRVDDLDLVVRPDDSPDGRVLSFSATALPVAGGGQEQNVVIVFRDVTERHRTEQALTAALATEHQAVEQLRDLERVKSDFVATVSHELRTPITSISGYLELLAGGAVGELDEAQTGIVDRLARNSERLLALVEDLLTLSQVESSGLTVTRVPADLRDIVSGAHEAVSVLLASRSLDVVLDLPDGAARCQVDPREMERVLVNLLTNAIKFTPDGGRIEVGLTVDDVGATLVVADTGLGIPEAEQDQLFTRFFRSSSATGRAIQGTGLGLAIVKAIVDLHGGSIEIASRAERGTRVTVRVPHATTVDDGTPPHLPVLITTP